MPEENNYLEKIVAHLEKVQLSVDDLNQKIELQNERIAKLEMEKVGKKFNNLETASVSPPPPPVAQKTEYQEILSESVSVPNDKTNSGEQSSLEENIGGKLFAKIGITAIVLGVAFFLKYSFDNNWIGPVGRVMIGMFWGIVLLGLGEKFIRKYFNYGQILSGGGLAVLYLSIFGAFSFYELIGQVPAFFMMFLFTIVGIILSVRYDAISLILVAIIGGFATPFLISSGKNAMLELFSYILILDLAILTISVFKKWRLLNALGFFGTMITFGSWVGEYYSEKQLFETMLFLTLFFVVYSISSLVYNLVKKENSSGVEQLLTLSSGTVYFLASYGLLNEHYHIFMGLFALLLAIYYFVWAYIVRALTPTDKNLYDFLAFLTIGFVTLAIPLQFEGKAIVIGWAIEAILMIILGIKSQNPVLRAFGVLIFGMATVRILTIDAWHEKGAEAFLNTVMISYVMLISMAYFSAYLFRVFFQKEERGVFLNTTQLMVIFLVGANFLTVYSISQEIIFSYDKKIEILREQEDRNDLEQKRIGNLISSKHRYDAIEKIENKSSVSLSLFWIFYGIILMLVGFFARNKSVRVGGLILFVIAILKLFIYDLWSLGTLYRIISSISLGVVLLLISFAYQKYKDKLREII